MCIRDRFALIKQQFATLKERSAFYAAKFEGIDLSDVQTQEDFEKLPFSEKDDLRNAYPLGLQAVPDEEDVYKRQVVFHASADLLDAAAKHAAELRKVLRSEDDKHHHQDKYELRHAHSEYLHRALLPGFLAFSAEHYSLSLIHI